MNKEINNSILLVVLIGCLVLIAAEAFSQSAGGTCTLGQNGQSFVTSGSPTQFLMCNGSDWVLAEDMVTSGSVGIAWGATAPTPAAALDVNGGIRVNGNDITSTSCSNAGEIGYTTSSTICGSGVSGCMAYCNGSNNWVSLSTSSTFTVGCPSSSATIYAGAQTHILYVAQGCQITFQLWGAGGGGAATTATGGGGGYATVTIPSSTSAVTYYLSAGGGGQASTVAGFGASGGAGVYGYTGAGGYGYNGSYSAGGASASGVWTLGFGGYSVGSASQSTTTVTGTGGTSWTSSMIGSTFSYTNGVSVGTVTGVTTGSSLTVSISSTVASQAYTIGVVAVAAGGAGGNVHGGTNVAGGSGGNCTSKTTACSPVTLGCDIAVSNYIEGGGAGYPTGGNYGSGGQNYAAYSGTTNTGSTTTPGNSSGLTALGTGQYSGYATGGSSGANGTDGVITWQTY